ncbi:MAG: glycoside hydrolase family 2 protein [Tannerella sp.]|jgi:beta-galactosidase|nr:glycoside hydrolase family 2 protein [Tannerella sp.]
MKNLFNYSIFLTILSVFALNSCDTRTGNPSVNTEESRKKFFFNDDWEFKKGEKEADAPWAKVAIPHTWNNVDMQTQRNDFYAGTACYQKIYTPDASLEGKRLFIRFEGVGATAEVFVNDEFAGNHLGGYSAFTIEITDLLKYGEKNHILVKADNSSRPDVIPVNHRLFGVYGGVYRPIELIITNKINISVNDYASPGIYIRQKNVSAQSADVHVKTKIDNRTGKSGKVGVNTTIYDMKGNALLFNDCTVEVAPQGRQTATADFRIKNPRLWQGLEDPYLYKVIVRLIQDGKVIDEVAQPLGLRHFELKAGDGMYLNGKKTPMFGVCRHQDWWQLGSALTNENHDTDLEIIKEIGATTIRLAHYQQSEYFYSKCDSIGFMIWAEIPFVNRVSTQEANNARQQLTELVRQNFNHPSIYVWGLHNEVYHPHNYTTDLTQSLNDLAKSEDPDRYTVQVSGYNKIDHPVNNNADIQGINQYFGWYNGTLDSMLPWVERSEKQFAEYKIIFSEYGTEANIYRQKEIVSNRGDCCGFDKDYNESFATRFHEEHWNVISKHPFLIASYIWNTFDFATPTSSQGQVESRNMKGLVTFDRKTKKDPFYWYKANWSKEPVLYITQRRVIDRGNEITPITVYSNIGEPKLFVNGTEISTVTIGYTDIHYIFTDVKLTEGENMVEVKVEKDGETYQDKAIWNYSETYKDLSNQAPEVRLKEHAGL